MQIGHRLLWYEYPLLNSKSGVSAVAVSVFPGGIAPPSPCKDCTHAVARGRHIPTNPLIFMPNQTFLKIYFRLRMDSAPGLSVPCPFLGYIHHS